MILPARWRRLSRIAFLVCLLAVFYLALAPKPVFTGADSDKVNHILAFFTLAALLRLGWPRQRLAIALSALVGLGALIEVLQYFVGRDAAFGDLLADTVGLLLGAAAARIFAQPPAAIPPASE